MGNSGKKSLKVVFTFMIIAKIMMMIIIFMLILTIIPEHYIKSFGPLCENISEFPPCTLETCELVPNLSPPSEVRVMSDTDR